MEILVTKKIIRMVFVLECIFLPEAPKGLSLVSRSKTQKRKRKRTEIEQ
jgi:hypothetical protein